MGFLSKLFGAKDPRGFSEEDVRIDPLQVDKSVPLDTARAQAAGAKPPQSAATPAPGRRSEQVKARVERVEPAAEKGSLRYLSPPKDAFMAEVSQTVSLMVNMADVIDQNYELMDDEERRKVVHTVRSMLMFLKYDKALQPAGEAQS